LGPDFEQRRDRLRKLMRKASLPALLVTDFVNVTYLTGFTGDDSFLLITADDAVAISDFRYIEQLAEECPELKTQIRVVGQKILESVVEVLGSMRLSQLGVEAESMTVAFRDRLAAAAPGVELAPASGLVEELREIKDKYEIEEIRRAVRIAEQAFGVVRASLRPEQSEKDVADAFENQVRLFGGKCTAFPPIVAIGPRSALPHARPLATRRMGEADFVLFDFGAAARLYLSDLTRVVATSRISPKLDAVYGVVLKAQLQAIAAIRPGAVMQEVDAVARNVIADAGYGEKFGHGLGHGFGLRIHEAPRLAVNENRPLKAGMIVTVEPGIYLPGWGGIRIEDDILVTRGGNERLSSLPRDLAENAIPL
jgi:Xaa-Pro aminopeptidase